MAIWYVNENSSWVAMPDPSSLTVNSEDLDVDSYRSVVNGNLIRNKLGTWTTVEFQFNFKYANDVISLLSHVINIYPLKIKVTSPLVSGGEATLIGYVGKSSSEYTYTQSGMGYVVNFNFIEGKKS